MKKLIILILAVILAYCFFTSCTSSRNVSEGYKQNNTAVVATTNNSYSNVYSGGYSTTVKGHYRTSKNGKTYYVKSYSRRRH